MVKNAAYKCSEIKQVMCNILKIECNYLSIYFIAYNLVRFLSRILYSGLTVTRYAPTVARYKMLVHAKDKSNPDRFHLLRTTKARRLQDGVNNLKYTVLKKEYRPLYTWILVSVNVTEIQNEISHKPSGSPLVNKTNSSASSVNSIKATNETEHSKTDAKSEIQQPGANKAQLAQPAATKLVLGRLRPVRISWIPRGFVGNLPENLTKVDPLPVIETPKVAKTVEELKQQQLALREQHENKTNNIDSVNRTNEDIDPKQQVLDLLQKMHQQQQQQQQQNEQHSDQMFSQQQQQKQQQQIINSNQNDQINNENERQKQYTLLQSNFQNSLQQNSEALQVVVEQQIIDQDRESQQQTALQSNVLQIQEKQHQQQQLQHQQHQQHQQQQQQQRQPEQQEQQHHQQQQQQRQRLLSSDSIVVVTS
ncbi:hypothetical protein DPMN_050787 [Dreissena polymorpha]|uniref:Beta-1,4-galactosyltransferase n=1 Tax=Dreissena polymorpha TaxID=45954 RepID=A0A9D4HNE9_DREPO|nr:hypothetical protein DPMN_050787 [Dreissena polymorpha]